MDQKEVSRRILEVFDRNTALVNKGDEMAQKYEADHHIEVIAIAQEAFGKGRYIVIGKVIGTNTIYKLIVGSMVIELSISELAGLAALLSIFADIQKI